MSTGGGRRPWRRWVSALGGVLVVAAGVIAGCGTGPGNAPEPGPPQATAGSAANPPGRGALADDFARLQARLHAKAGVVLRSVGAVPAAPITLGDWNSGPAWSTIKVPLVIAAMRGQDTERVTQPMTAAIVASDNAAAESIWEGLGDPTVAAEKVGAVLHEAGDPTRVESRKLRPEYTAFGQTDWSLANQALFLSAAACDPRDRPVLALMGQVDADQRWGLGVLPETRIKGGWGPSPSGRYLVRQIGILPTPSGLTAVAMAAEPESGSFDDGTRDLTEIAQWLHAHRDDLSAGRCDS